MGRRRRRPEKEEEQDFGEDNYERLHEESRLPQATKKQDTMIIDHHDVQRAMSRRRFGHTRPASGGALVLLVVVASSLLLLITRQAEAQYLFTYEINQESDDSRAPKSSLFDPSAFKIVTPSQLQSSYQRLAGSPPEQAPLSPGLSQAAPPPPPSISSSGPAASFSQQGGASAHSAQELAPPQVTTTQSSVVSQTPPTPSSSNSFIKQTSAAIQSLAELFSLNSAPSAPTSPVAGSGATNQLFQQQFDKQAEARSLHEHWTQQQQKAHASHQQQQQQQQQTGNELSPALASFTTSTTTAASVQNFATQQTGPSSGGSGASYWLTSSPINGPDGNFLVEIKTPTAGTRQQQREEESTSGGAERGQMVSSLVDNLLSVGQAQHQPQPQQHFGMPRTSGVTPASVTPAQSSFLSTPTSYYPQPSARAPSPTGSNSFRPPVRQATGGRAAQASQANHFPQPQSQALHQHQARSLINSQPPAPRQTTASQYQLLDSNTQLQPPANAPPAEHQHDNFVTTPVTPISHAHHQHQHPILKSAQESLLAFRQQQQHQHDQQSAQMAAQNSLASAAAAAGASGAILREPASAPAKQQTLGEIPSVSPQIYESFLLQQKDQYEKHMELLKQQQEVNKLLEQKRRDEAERTKNKRNKQQTTTTNNDGDYERAVDPKLKERQRAAALKKEELERVEARKKAIAARTAEREQAERRARLAAAAEAEEAARRKELQAQRQRQEAAEADKRRQAAEALEEERRYREFLERQEAEQQLKQRNEERRQAELKAAAEAELRREREQQEREAAAQLAAQKRRREQLERDELARKQQQLRAYLRQQEELKKLLELKQREDELTAARRAAAAAAAAATTTTTPAPPTTTSTSTTPAPPFAPYGRSVAAQQQSSRANRLALEHRERSRHQNQRTSSATLSSWGGRATRSRPLASESVPASSFTPTTTTSTTTTTTTSTTTTQATPARGRGKGALESRRLKAAADEQLIRQKIPLYSGAGKYGLIGSRPGSSGNDTTLADLMALLDSVTLPATSSTTTTTTTTTTPQPPPTTSGGQVRDNVASSLSPLMNARDLSVTASPFPAHSTNDPMLSSTGASIFDDDDVPRRPVATRRGVSARATSGQATAASSIVTTTGSLSNTERTLPLPVTRRTGAVFASPPTSNTTTTSGGRAASIGLASLPADADNDGIPGRAGVEYPVLAAVPPTSFTCAKQPLNGYYADTETACQVVHLCQGGAQSSILCPNGTIFNQEKFSCQWWYEVNCSRAPMFYQLNDNLYKAAVAAGATDTSGDSAVLTRLKPARGSRANSL